jgi:antitoxin component of RelBE/YafQ-DinJ toxin-antitoxin module
MTSNTHLQTWVSREFKERFAKVAQARGLSKSALLRRLLENLLPADRLPDDVLVTPVEKVSSAPRVSVRLRADDLLLLQARQYRLS